MLKSPFPHFTFGTIVRGFGRGSKELNCPTANLDDSAADRLPVTIDEGVYYGWAQIIKRTRQPIYRTVTSIGTNPFYNGQKKTIEAHLMHEFDKDFYGEQLRLVLLGKIRPMKNFACFQDFLDAIDNDLREAKKLLELKTAREICDHEFFK